MRVYIVNFANEKGAMFLAEDLCELAAIVQTCGKTFQSCMDIGRVENWDDDAGTDHGVTAKH